MRRRDMTRIAHGALVAVVIGEEIHLLVNGYAPTQYAMQFGTDELLPYFCECNFDRDSEVGVKHEDVSHIITQAIAYGGRSIVCRTHDELYEQIEGLPVAMADVRDLEENGRIIKGK